MPPLLKLILHFGRSAVHHIGARFVTQEHGARLPENDTIVPAAAVAWANTTGKFPDDWFAPDGGAVACSGLLPVLLDEDGKEHLYLPVPPKSIEINPAEQLHLIKVVNKVRWLREDVWRQWASGVDVAELVLGEYFSEFEKRNGKPKEPPLTLSEYDGKWVKRSVQERVLLQPDMLEARAEREREAMRNDRKPADEIGKVVAKASDPYRVASFRFAKGAAAAVVVDAGGHEAEFIKAVKLLGLAGIGGDRTYGYGQYQFEPSKDKSNFNLPEIAPAGAALTLGLMYPGHSPSGEMQSALSHSASRWQAISRQGRNTVPGTSQMVVSKRVRMVDKGALLAGLAPGALGHPVNVFPECYTPEPPLEPWQKRIWRSGRTIALPVKLPDGNGSAGGAK
ncbi:MAG: hypothetical protein HRF49_03660 [bacterium]|jgi:CRISPR type III-A-associated RAMP protein Csm4